ncbi:MAG: HTTM domain-containing protein [Polyangiaceae bacterium]
MSALHRLGRYLRDDWALFLVRFGKVWDWHAARFFYLDPRTLGLTRIIVGVLMMLDCLRHAAVAELYYSNSGVLTNHYNLFSPSSSHHFSLFHVFSTPAEVHVAFGLAFLCYFFFAIGYRARLFNILSLIWVTSTDSRLILVENGGYVVVNLLVFYLCWLPTGRRFSVDALLRSAREQREQTLDDLRADHRPGWLTDRHRSFACLMVVANFGIIYIFNVINKYGDIWREGLTVHYVLHIDRMVTGLAVPFREHMPLWLSRIVTWLVLVVEATIAMAIFWPENRRITRPLAMVLVFGLHLAFGVMMRLGPFAWFMIAWSSLLLMTVHWEMIEAAYARRQPSIEVRFDTGSGLAWTLVRLARRLDVTRRLVFDGDAPATGVLQARQEGGPWRSGRAAFWLTLRAMIGGRYLLPILRLLLLGLPDLVVLVLFAAPERWARFFGLLAPPRDPRRAHPPQEPSPFRQRLDRYRRRARDLALGFYTLLFLSQLVNENKSLPPPMKHDVPGLIHMFLVYPRLFQGWGMFAPNPIREDGVVAIDAITVDGRHIDPLRGGAPPDLDLSDDRGSGLQQIEQDYMNRIRMKDNARFRHPLRLWLQSYHQRTGRPEDEIIFFEVFWLTDQNPEPGSDKPTDHEAICIASWKKRGARLPPGMPPLPAKPCTPAYAGK